MWPADQRSRERQWRRRSARLMVKQTKEGLDVLETNQPHPRPLLTFYRSSWNNLIPISALPPERGTSYPQLSHPGRRSYSLCISHVRLISLS